MYQKALRAVIAEIKAKGYVTFPESEDILQKQISEFERYYVKKHEIDPFSSEFVHLFFTEFNERLKSLPQLKTKRLTEQEVDEVGYAEIYGFDQVAFERWRKNARRE